MTIADTPLIRPSSQRWEFHTSREEPFLHNPPNTHQKTPILFRQNAAVLEDLDWWLWWLWFDIGSCGLTSEESNWKCRTSEESAYMFEHFIFI